ncbi:hypothetical protein Q0Z83_079270 [Actinoplanes sichuanensis]|uniref:Uncharacterized protein n=1 Tax=Actinoplanes sichuanensis TaxID=512349 RepID=A0ABW4ADW1_9ACTN|nr:hypothetical protein [Actinoplanes sichuanensis]BEL09736.1 hypothetical protein Q0Z83_079270 [Actinoplanes sichuanensis]
MTDRQTAPETVEESRLTAALLAVAAVGWTAAMLWSARASITSRADAAMEVTSTAYALPGAVSADLVAGAAVALLVLTLISGRWALGATARFAVATGSGLLVGVLSAIPIITINTLGTIYAAVGGTVAAAATIGGAFAGLRIPRVISASAAAAVGVFLIGFVLNLFQEPVLSAFGAGDTESSANAAQWFSYSQAALSGLAAGLIAYLLLRRAGTGVRWPLYALAGAGPGLLLVIGELLSRTAGAKVLELAGKVSELEQTVQELLSTARLNNALIVLFAGALTAIFAVGRTLGSPADEPETDDATSPATSAPRTAAEDTADEAEEETQSSSSSSETAYHSNS